MLGNCPGRRDASALLHWLKCSITEMSRVHMETTIERHEADNDNLQAAHPREALLLLDGLENGASWPVY